MIENGSRESRESDAALKGFANAGGPLTAERGELGMFAVTGM
jgi:hypothetical protein